MIKQLILLVQLLGLFFYQLIFTGDLAVTQKVSDSMIQGKESLIEITINKDDVSGFAKVQQIFPEGFSAEPVETKGATFSFKDNKIKFIWMALPAEKEFTISYKIKPNETTKGNFTLSGKFSFISESERKNIEIPSANFSVIAEDLIAEVVEEKHEDEESEIVEEIVEPDAEVVLTEEAPEEIIEEVVASEESLEGVGDVESVAAVELVPTEEADILKILTIKGTRTIENVGGRKYKITIEIEKKGVEGFAKITEEIPEGFVASENDSKGGVFSFKKSDAKILWMAVPKEDTYTISYNIEANENTANGNYNIIGHYSYLDNDVTSKYDIDGSSFDLNVEELIVEEADVEESKVDLEAAVSNEVLVETVVEETLENETVSEIIEEEADVVIEEIPVVEETIEEKPVVANNTNEITSTPNPEHGVTYKVQVGAGHKSVSSTYFKTKFSLKDNVSTMNHEGWIKYLVGSFDEYKAARDKRNTVRNNVKTAFVTAYNSGTRITVQEALMISRQKWYK
jgi:hypothetical protein